MYIGMLELFLLVLIVAVLFGPAIARKINKYQSLYTKRNKRLQKVAAQRKAEELARRQIRNAKIKIAAISIVSACVVFGAIYLACWPVSTEVNSYRSASADAAAISVYDAASAVDTQQTLSIDAYKNLAQIRYYNEWIYAVAEGGTIIRIRENGTGLTELVATGGEILSFDFDAEDNIIFTDAQYDVQGGALLKASFDGFAVTVEPLLQSGGGMVLSSPTAVTVATDGMIYFLNASGQSAAEQSSMLQALRTSQIAHTQDGALFAYDPTTGECEVMLSGLCFAAGLALSTQEDVLYLSTLTDASIWAVDVSARAASFADAAVRQLCVVADGYPAGLSIAEDGTLYVAVISPEMSWVESLSELPAWRAVLLRLPQGTRDALMQYHGAGLVLALDADGSYIASYTTVSNNGWNMLASVCAVGERIYYSLGASKDALGYFTL